MCALPELLLCSHWVTFAYDEIHLLLVDSDLPKRLNALGFHVLHSALKSSSLK